MAEMEGGDGTGGACGLVALWAGRARLLAAKSGMGEQSARQGRRTKDCTREREA